MKSAFRAFVWVLILSGTGFFARARDANQDQSIAEKFPPQLADYDAEPRLPNGRVDVEKLAARLRQLGVNTYYFLVLHATNDWEDLKLFLPVAASNHIEVWVYIVPPSESPPVEGNTYSEPFRLDYPRWAEEIAKLSLQHTNLTAWVIDDFYQNHKLFTPDYIRAMQQRAKQMNPKLLFFPLMYFYEINPRFARDYHDVIDGAVVAYPPDTAEIERAHAVLNDMPVAQRAELAFPASTTSVPGDFASASQRAPVTSDHGAMIRFREREDYTGSTSGYHFKQLLINGKVVWEEDVAGGTNGWREVQVDLPASALGETNVEVTFRLFDKQGVGNFPVRWQLADVQAKGITVAAPLSQPEKWDVKVQGAFDAGFGKKLMTQTGRWHLPFIVMTAGQTVEFRLRHGDPATPERMADWVSMCMACLRKGTCDGVVTYALDKENGSRVFDLVRTIFLDYRRGMN